MLVIFSSYCPGGRYIRIIQGMNENYAATLLALSALVTSLFILYWRAMSFSFFGDDFYLLSIISEGPWKVILPIREIYHYFPVTLLLIGAPRWLGVGEPGVYHFINIALHCVNAALVYALALLLLRSRFYALGASIMFSFFFLNYDPVLWPLVGNHYLVAAMFCLVSFLSFVGYVEHGTRRRLWLYAACSILAMYTHETAVPLLLICVYYGLTKGTPRPTLSFARIAPLLKPHTAPAVALAFLFIVKYHYTSNIIVSRLSPRKVLENLSAAACLLSPLNNMNAYWVFSKFGQDLAFLLLISATVLLILGLCYAKTSRELKLTMLWSALFILPGITVAEPGPRYFYLPSVGWAIFLAGTARAFVDRLSLKRLCSSEESTIEKRTFLAYAAAGIFFVVISLQGWRHANKLMDVWEKGDKIARSAVITAVELIERHPNRKKILIVDQPTRYTGNDFFGAPLLISNMRFALALHMNTDCCVIESVRLHSENMFDASFPMVSKADLDAASQDPSTLVIIYEPETRAMVPYD
ncbi:MAG: hypothetical protein Kow0099_05550 [Candidatus Abyssubacteria bacterium]